MLFGGGSDILALFGGMPPEHKNYREVNRHGKENLLNALNDPDSLIEVLNKDPELAEIFVKMPFRGIVVRQEDGSNDLSKLEPFAGGKYQKIIVVNQGELESGIKQSIKAYAEQNPKYKEKLSPDFKKQVEPESPKKPNNTDSNDNDNGNKKGNSLLKYVLGACTLLGIGSGVYLWNRSKKNVKKLDSKKNI